MQVLNERRSSREFVSGTVAPQMLSNLLWAADGVSRHDTGRRTAPSAQDRQEIDIYVAIADGLYLYDAKAQELKLMNAKDLRALTGRQDFVAQAPVNLVYVADFARMGAHMNIDEKLFYSAIDTGFIAQNVYLYCASEGLATAVRGSVDRKALAAAMHLGSEQHVMLSQTVGFARK
ncbi:MAG: SagB/ThcOx family dehydrogenase [Acidiferrobacterales bacterium]